jgi:hypothetical protein
MKTLRILTIIFILIIVLCLYPVNLETTHPYHRHLIESFSYEQMMENLRILTGETPYGTELISTRHAHTKGQSLAADFLLDAFTSMGYTDVIDSFDQSFDVFDMDLRYGRIVLAGRHSVMKGNPLVNLADSLISRYPFITSSVFPTFSGDTGYAVLGFTEGSEYLGKILRFSEGHWSILSDTPYLTCLKFLSDTHGFAAGLSGSFYEIIRTDSTDIINRLTAISAMTLTEDLILERRQMIACGYYGALSFRPDFDSAFVNISTGTSAHLLAAAYNNRGSFLIGGQTGFLVRYDISERVLYPVLLPVFNDINSIAFTSTGTGFLVTSAGDLFISFDGGDIWDFQYRIASTSLNSVQAEGMSVYVAGERGIIRYSSDGGESWSDIPTINKSANIIATKNSFYPITSYYFLGAHYDNVGEYPFYYAHGADDNGTGTVIVLEAARILADIPVFNPIKFCLWQVKRLVLPVHHHGQEGSYKRFS